MGLTEVVHAPLGSCLAVLKHTQRRYIIHHIIVQGAGQDNGVGRGGRGLLGHDHTSRIS